MNSLISQIFRDRNSKTSIFFVIGILFLAGLGCTGGKNKDAKPVPSEYFGAWTGSDGSTIAIRGDGSGDYKSGGTSVNGGTVEINDADKTLSITFFGIGPTLKIDKAPSGNQMTLDGIVYKKPGGSDTKSDKTTSSKSDDDSTGELPATKEVEALIKSSFTYFTSGVDDEDFSDFYDHSSSDFQNSNSKDEIKSAFSVFIDKKVRLLPSLRDIQTKSANFTAAPSVETVTGSKMLTADGEFPSKPNATKFETKYQWEDGEWKVFKFKVKL